MAYKRNIDRLPIIPAGAKEHNVTCHYCIVGCGYKAYTWPLKTQGTTDSNWSGEDLSKQQGAETAAWYAPSMYNVVKQNGKDVHLVGEQIRCVVSVSMLTEGWDANTVTHVLGVRAFGTQLLCE